MKAFKVELLIIGHCRSLDAAGLVAEIENVNYPNDCISPSVMKVVEVDIGEWSDDHPLNSRLTSAEEYKRLFGPAKCTLCTPGVDCDGFANVCIVNETPEHANGWLCDGKGNLTRPEIPL